MNGHFQVYMALSLQVRIEWVSAADADTRGTLFQVVNGPMDVVKSIDRMVTHLSPHLMSQTDQLTITSPNISELHQNVCNTNI